MTDIKPLIGLEDAFGQRARELRKLQGCLLDLFASHHYQEVIPPFVERPETLNVGTGRFLSHQTVVFSDPAGAGLLAIRPDITPQVARIAATRLQAEAELRLCYSGPVLLARPDSHSGSRQQWQTGIECLGVAGEQADQEVIHLAVLAMQAAGFAHPLLQVGHMGLLRALIEGSSTPIEIWAQLLARRSPEDMAEHLRDEKLSEAAGKALLDMASGMGDRDWLAATSVNAAFDQAASELLHLVDTIAARLEDDFDLCIDVCVMPKFLYHNGIVFSGFAAGSAQELLCGGRYDTMMAAHGRDMAATGFSVDLFAWLDARGNKSL